MKRIIFGKYLALPVLALLLFCTSVFAGVEHYQVYLNNKLVLVKSVLEPVSVMSLLDKLNSKDEIVVHYSHCGQRGKDRHIDLKDEKGTVVKEWRFSDDNDGMTIAAKEIAALQQKYGSLTLNYSSKELPGGRTLASLKGNGKTLASAILPVVAQDPWMRLTI